MFSNVFIAIKIALIFRNSIIKQFKCDLGNKSCFLLRMVVLYEEILEEEFFFLFQVTIYELSTDHTQCISQGNSGKASYRCRITRMTISGADLALKAGTDPIFHNFKMTCFPNQIMMFSLCVENFP